MNLLPILVAVVTAGCTVDPADGHTHYDPAKIEAASAKAKAAYCVQPYAARMAAHQAAMAAAAAAAKRPELAAVPYLDPCVAP